MTLNVPRGGLRGVLVQPSFDAPRGTMVSRRWGIQMHPYDHMVMRHGGRCPLWTRHTLGNREAERDARRRARRGR